ncbi:hypothetical protein KI387_002420, partial [Taxus chinensis]
AISQLDIALHAWQAGIEAAVNRTISKSYAHALHGRLSKCIMPDSKSSFKSRTSSSLRTNAPPLFIICCDYYHAYDRMPEKLVIEKIQNFAIEVQALREQQDEEQHL